MAKPKVTKREPPDLLELLPLIVKMDAIIQALKNHPVRCGRHILDVKSRNEMGWDEIDRVDTCIYDLKPRIIELLARVLNATARRKQLNRKTK